MGLGRKGVKVPGIKGVLNVGKKNAKPSLVVKGLKDKFTFGKMLHVPVPAAAQRSETFPTLKALIHLEGCVGSLMYRKTGLQ